VLEIGCSFTKHLHRRSTPHRPAHLLNRYHAILPCGLAGGSSSPATQSPPPSTSSPQLTPRTSPSRSPCSLRPLFRLLLFSIYIVHASFLSFHCEMPREITKPMRRTALDAPPRVHILCNPITCRSSYKHITRWYRISSLNLDLELSSRPLFLSSLPHLHLQILSEFLCTPWWTNDARPGSETVRSNCFATSAQRPFYHVCYTLPEG